MSLCQICEVGLSFVTHFWFYSSDLIFSPFNPFCCVNLNQTNLKFPLYPSVRFLNFECMLNDLQHQPFPLFRFPLILTLHSWFLLIFIVYFPKIKKIMGILGGLKDEGWISPPHSATSRNSTPLGLRCKMLYDSD